MRRWAEAAADSSCRGATRPGRPASPGLSHGDLREQQHRPGLLQPHRRSHDDRGLPFPGESSGLLGAGGGSRGRRPRGSRRHRAPGAGRVLGPGLRGAGAAGGWGPAGWVGRFATEGRQHSGGLGPGHLGEP